MSGDDGYSGTVLAVFGCVTALAGLAATVFGGPWWLWAGLVVFLAAWLAAIVGLSNANSRAFLAGTLRKSTYTQIYTALSGRLVASLWTNFCNPVAPRASSAALFHGALTWQLYDKALLIAVTYPIMLMVGQWIATGQPLHIGVITFPDQAKFWWERATALLTIMTFILLLGMKGIFARSEKTWVQLLTRWAPPLFVGGMVAALLITTPAVSDNTYLAASIFTLALLGFSIAIALVPRHPGAIAFALSFAGTGAFAIFLSALVFFLDRRARPRMARWIVTIYAVGLVPIFALAATGLDEMAGMAATSVLVIIVVAFPLLNAWFDTLSYAMTLALMRRGIRSRAPWLWGLLDLTVACLLFLTLGMALVIVIHTMNLVSDRTLVDLPKMFSAIQQNPWDYLWLHAMLFSTILPTVLHACFSLLGIQGIWPRVWRRPVANWILGAPISALSALRAGLALAVLWALPLVMIGGAVWAFWAIGGDALLLALAAYFHVLSWIVSGTVG